MPEMNLKQCGKTKKRMQKFKERRDSRYLSKQWWGYHWQSH